MGEPMLLAVAWTDRDLQLDPIRAEAVELGPEQAAEGLGSQRHPGVVVLPSDGGITSPQGLGSAPKFVEQILVKGTSQHSAILPSAMRNTPTVCQVRSWPSRSSWPSASCTAHCSPARMARGSTRKVALAWARRAAK